MKYVIQDSHDHSYIYTDNNNFNVGVISLRQARQFDSISDAEQFMENNFRDDYIPENNIIEYKPGTIFTEDWQGTPISYIHYENTERSAQNCTNTAGV